ncbi:MAG: hypothetical protein ACODAC_11435, partial [Pseudomonadota bacterium]
MNLTAWWNLVKPQRLVLMVAFAATLASLVTLHVIVEVTDDAPARRDRFGAATARALAELAVEPMMKQDRLHLGVLGNRLVETPEVAGVATYSADDRVLASTGTLDAPG